MSAIADAMSRFSCSEKTVKNALKQGREIKALGKEFKAAADRIVENAGEEALFLALQEILRTLDAEDDQLGLPKNLRPLRVEET
jgi:hypothetical protein